MIQVNNITKSFGGVLAVNSCSLTIKQGSITGLIGPNGAGKTTLFNIIAGMVAPSSGQILFNGVDITHYKAHELFHLGILRTFQIAHEFSSMTVLENLMMVPGNQVGESITNTWFARNKIKKQEQEIYEKAVDVCDFLQISHLRDALAGNLSGGQKKLLELGRTMMVDAKIVLLDEVGAGVNRTLLNTIGEAIQRLNQERGYTFCMIEHDIEFINKLCDPIIVMAEGSVLIEGDMETIKNNEQVIESYLGRGAT